MGALAATASAKEARLPLAHLGSFVEPKGLAVDQGSGDVYAIDGRSERQQVTISATAGQFRLKFGALETGDLAFGIKAEPLENALRSAFCGGGPCISILGRPDDATGSTPYEIIFVLALASTDVPELECAAGTTPLSGGSGCSVTTTTNGVDGTIARYQADGTPANFTALGSNAIDGRGPGLDLTPQGGLHFSSLNTFARLAVDESGGVTDGDIYVIQTFDHLVDVFAPSGEFKGQLTDYTEGVSKPLETICGVAVDGGGDVYVSDPASGIHKYDPAADPVSNADSVANFTSVSNPCGLAAGAAPTAGSLFAANFGLGAAVFKLDATTGETKYGFSEDVDSSATVTVDPTSGHVLIGTGGEVKEFDASAASSATPLGSIAAASTVEGVAVNGTTGKGGTLYLSRANVTHLDVYGPLVEVALVETKAALPAGTSAIFNGTISADGGPEASCHFQYLPAATFQAQTAAVQGASEPKTQEEIEEAAFAGAQSAPCEPPGPFSGSALNEVSGKAEGLSPETTYEFRILGTNSNGTVPGAPEDFETLGKPQIEGGSISLVTTDSALVSGEINPRSLPTEFAVQYVTQADFEASQYANATSVAGAGKPSGSVLAQVSVALSGLQPATTYHFRLIASNESGTATPGPDRTFTTYANPLPPQPCVNDPLRSGLGARAPDCRAYEQVSPVEKDGFSVFGRPQFNQAAADGHAAVFGSLGGLPTSGGIYDSPAYVASRGAGGWTYDGALPAVESGASAYEQGRDDELHTSLSAVTGPAGSSLYLTDLNTFTRQSVLAGAGYHALPNPQFADDTDHFIFEDSDGLVPGALSGSEMRNLYDYDHGILTLAGMVPVFPATSCSGGACVPAPGGSFAGSYNTTRSPGNLANGDNTYKPHAISADGSKVFFTEAGSGRLYMRLDGTETVQVSASQAAGPDPNGHKPASFLAATPDGATVYFSSCERLTDDSTAVSTAANTCLTPAQGADLYEYDTETEELSDLSVDPAAGDPQRAGVQGMLGASPDGAYVYFVANGVLAAGAPSGNCNTFGLERLTGSCSLYVEHGGTTTFVAGLGAVLGQGSENDSQNWIQTVRDDRTKERTSRVAADGTVLFSSLRNLTGYDSGGKQELYRYAPGDAGPACVSCVPTGAAPVAGAHLASDQKFGLGGLRYRSSLEYLPRNLSASGDRIFFETADKLIGADVDGDVGCPAEPLAAARPCQDVYEWEAEGTGSCDSNAQDGGCLYLISTGTSSTASFFDDASASGNDVFLYTDTPLVPQDQDGLVDLYDARVEGGLASQHQTKPPPCDVNAGACEGPGSIAQERQGAGTAVFQGPGNHVPKRCSKGEVRRHGHCVKKRRKHHHRRAGR
jgi:hypothetical protein